MRHLVVLVLASCTFASESTSLDVPDAETSSDRRHPDAPIPPPMIDAPIVVPTPDAPPVAATFPIDHVVVIVKENHTFDNYFGSLPRRRGHVGRAHLVGRRRRRPPADPPSSRPLPLARLRARRLGRRPDERLEPGRPEERLGPPRVHAVPGGGHPELLAIRAALRPRRSFLRVGARAVVPGALVLPRRAGGLGARQSVAARPLGLRRRERHHRRGGGSGHLHGEGRLSLLRFPDGAGPLAGGRDLEVLRLAGAAAHRRDVVDVRRRRSHPQLAGLESPRARPDRVRQRREERHAAERRLARRPGPERRASAARHLRRRELGRRPREPPREEPVLGRTSRSS